MKNQNKTSKTLSAMLASVMIVSALTGCTQRQGGGSGDDSTAVTPDDTTITEQTGEEEYLAQYPYEISNFKEGNDEYKFTFLNYIDDFWLGANHILDYEEEPEDSVGQAVYVRNRHCEDKLGIVINVEKSDMQGIQRLLREAVGSGDDYYDVVYMPLNWANSVVGIKDENLLNLHKIDGFNFNENYWNKTYIEAATYGKNEYERLCIIPDYYNLMGYAYSNALYCNLSMIKEYNLDTPYDFVRNKTWTYDKMFNYYVDTCANLNGDMSFTADNNSNCIFGLTVMHFEGLMSMFNGAGKYFTAKDSDNNPVLVENILPLYDVYSTLQDYVSKPGYCMMINDKNGWSGKGLFVADRGVFYQGSIGISISSDFRNMKSTYTILPFPMYNEEQDNYYTMISQYTLSMGVPIVASDPVRTAKIMDYMEYVSYKDVIPVLMDALCYKGVRDDDAIEMLQILLDTQTVDPGFLYAFTFDLMEPLFSQKIVQGEVNFTSVYDSQKQRMNTLIENYIADLDE